MISLIDTSSFNEETKDAFKNIEIGIIELSKNDFENLSVNVVSMDGSILAHKDISEDLKSKLQYLGIKVITTKLGNKDGKFGPHCIFGQIKKIL
jgi:N-dimethylarginine dimethylaminohydrolase